MKPVSPVLLDQPDTKSLEVEIAKNQPQYLPLPALLVREAVNGAPGEYVDSLMKSNYVITRWELTDEEIETLRKTKSLYFFQWNFGRPLSPVMLQVDAPMASNQTSGITDDSDNR